MHKKLITAFIAWSVINEVWTVFFQPFSSDVALWERYSMTPVGYGITILITVIGIVSLYGLWKKRIWGARALYLYFSLTLAEIVFGTGLVLFDFESVKNVYLVSRAARGLVTSPEIAQHLTSLPFLIPCFGYIVMYICFIVHVYRHADYFHHSKTKEISAEKIRKYKKFGGLLWIPAIGLVITIFRFALVTLVELFLGVVKLLSSTFGPDVDGAIWNSFTPHGSEIWGPQLLFEAVSYEVTLIFALVVAFKFFRRKKETPKLYITFMIFSLVVLILAEIFINTSPAMATLDNGSTRAYIKKFVLACVIWIPYFLESERVKVYFSK